MQAITFRSEFEMVAAGAKLPLGSLAFIVSDELLFMRVQQGLRQVQVI